MDLREITEEPFRRHPWETIRAEFFGQLLSQHGLATKTESILDVGSGDGWLAGEMLRFLSKARATCWDIGYDDNQVRVFDLQNRERLDFTSRQPDGQFDLIMLLDVLEHLDDDRGLLASLANGNATNQTYFLVSAPAWGSLYCSHDATFTHRRRYAPQELAGLLNEAGLRIISHGELFHAALLPRLARVFAEAVNGRRHLARSPQPLFWRHGEPAARLVEAIVRAESRLSRFAADRHVFIPGLSTWALCRRG